jgi:hypothetical protein
MVSIAGAKLRSFNAKRSAWRQRQLPNSAAAQETAAAAGERQRMESFPVRAEGNGARIRNLQAETSRNQVSLFRKGTQNSSRSCSLTGSRGKATNGKCPGSRGGKRSRDSESASRELSKSGFAFSQGHTRQRAWQRDAKQQQQQQQQQDIPVRFDAYSVCLSACTNTDSVRQAVCVPNTPTRARARSAGLRHKHSVFTIVWHA